MAGGSQASRTGALSQAGIAVWCIPCGARRNAGQFLRVCRLSLAGSVATLWANAVEASAQIRLLEDQKQNNQTGLEILELRNRRGQASAIDVAQQRQLVEAASCEIIQAKARLAVTTNALLVLAGEMPGSRTADFTRPPPVPGLALRLEKDYPAATGSTVAGPAAP